MYYRKKDDLGVFGVRESNIPNYGLEGEVAVHGCGKATASLIILGEAPGAEEVTAGEPFVGRAGKFLTWGLVQAGIMRRACWLTNVLTRRPPKNDISHVLAKEALHHEKPGLREELESLYNNGAQVVLALGNTATKALHIEGNISSVRGSVYLYSVETHQIVSQPTGKTLLVIPTFHPSYLLRSRFNRSGGKADLTVTWLSDLRKAQEIAENGWEEVRENFNLTPTLDQLEVFLRDAQINDARLAIDIEATSLSSDTGQVVCVGIATSSETAIVVPQINPFASDEYIAASKELLNTYLPRCRLMFQNALYDVSYLQYHGYNVPWENVEHDTLLLHHAISPELPHNLGYIVSVYGSTPYWKDEFLNREKSILRLDWGTELAPYNARDCVVLHQILEPMLRDLREHEGLEDVYKNESIALLPAIAEMQQTGVLLSKSKLRSWKEYLQTRRTELETSLREIASLPAAFNLNSDEDLRFFLYGIESPKYIKSSDWSKKREGTKIRQELKELYDVWTLTVPLWLPPKSFKPRTTDTGKIAVNNQARLSLQRHATKRLEEIKQLKNPKPEEKVALKGLITWLSTFNEYAATVKLISTYTQFPVKADNRVHTSYIIHGTATGRLSSREPNLQNLPKSSDETEADCATPDVRELFVAPPDYVIVAADYSNLEVKVLAYETKDDVLIDIVDNNKNLHDINTEILFGLTKDDPRWKSGRKVAKVFMFGGIAYGGGDEEIYQRSILQAPDLGLTLSAFKEAKQRYMEAHPAYATWRDSIEDRVQRTKQITNAFGRIRTFLGNPRDIVKQALNFPIQSAAGSIINRATVRLYKRFHELHLRSRLQAQIHDELRFEVWKPELELVLGLIKQEMERPVLFYDTERTFNIEIEAGPDWRHLKECAWDSSIAS